MTSKQGKIYYGNAKNDKKEGFGVYYVSKPLKVYIGFWKNNKQEGVGKLITEKSSKYGFWNQGEKLNWFENFDSAIIHLGSDQVKMQNALKIELKHINKVISKISII